ncbi:Hypothetical_protein [Hexamita inflata]|uniref:Hypothetical_protein n=1 Tax=Hexamita inflata TaxID=28002 RepID=A0AA86UNM8_9EUKA|nr:Hypothetical protein HINF_LOCUS33423 [Hexamita inflata]
MKLVKFALFLRLLGSFLVLFSFNTWLFNQYADYLNRRMDTQSYYAFSLTSLITILVYIFIFILASVLLSFRSKICSCCCVCSSCWCCLRGGEFNSFKFKHKSVYYLIRSISVLLTSGFVLFFFFSVFSGSEKRMVISGLIVDVCFIFQFIFKTVLDYKTISAFCAQRGAKKGVFMVERYQGTVDVAAW